MATGRPARPLPMAIHSVTSSEKAQVEGSLLTQPRERPGDALARWSPVHGAVAPGSPARYTRGLSQVHARSIALRNREPGRQTSRVLRAALRVRQAARPVSA